MKFIDIILQNSQAKEAKLYGPSKKASEKPETGVVIQNPSAFHVIKDCATLANKYLPHYIFGLYANPFEVLKGKFTKASVEEFVQSANSDIVQYQLLVLIVKKAQQLIGEPGNSSETVPININTSSSDPYGEYESYSQPVNTTKSTDTVTIICTAFQVTS
jgi:hypothetical protein